jgi:hypothetical protein
MQAAIQARLPVAVATGDYRFSLEHNNQQRKAAQSAFPKTDPPLEIK